MPVSPAHIAGVGIAGLESSGSVPSSTALDEFAVSAATKALLDAGVTYNDVDQSIACSLQGQLRIQRSCFGIFGLSGAPICEVDNHSGLSLAVQSVKSGQPDCTLVVGIDQEASKLVAVALVLVSRLFLTSHAYLKDSAVCIRACSSASRRHSPLLSGPKDPRVSKNVIHTALRQAQLEPKDIQVVEVPQQTTSDSREALGGLEFSGLREPSTSLNSFNGTTGLAGLCGLVWQLRGWAHDRSISGVQHCLQYTVSPDGASSVVILCRSDGKAAPAWSDIENMRDGRERHGYNPAVEARQICNEDLAAVRANADFMPRVSVIQLRLAPKGGDRAALARL